MSLEFDALEPVLAEDPSLAEDPNASSLLELPLRVWAEIGRTRMPASSVVGMAEGTIVDLDCHPDDPADLFVNGRHFGTGRVVLVDGEWALRVESIDDEVLEQPSSDAQTDVETGD